MSEGQAGADGAAALARVIGGIEREPGIAEAIVPTEPPGEVFIQREGDFQAVDLRGECRIDIQAGLLVLALCDVLDHRVCA